MAEPEKAESEKTYSAAKGDDFVCEPFNEDPADPTKQEIIALDRFAVSDEKGTCEAETLDDYLADMPRLREYIRAYKATLDSSVTTALSTLGEVKNPAIRQNARMLCEHTRDNFDHIIFSVLSFVDAKKNPEIIQRILQNKEAPRIQFEETSERLLGQTVTELFKVKLDPPTVIISSNNEAHLNYGNIKNTFVHEFAHVFLQAGTSNDRRFVFEGVTELISRSSSQPTDSLCYPVETDLAKALMEIDKDALLDWYTGGSNEDFLNRLKPSLSIRYPDSDAEALQAKIDQVFKGFPIVRGPYQKQKADYIASRIRHTQNGSPDYETATTISKLPLENMADLVSLQDALEAAGAENNKEVARKFEVIATEESKAVLVYIQDIIAELKGAPLSSSN